jgi:hypothetical protein
MGCARMTVGIGPYFHVVSACNHVAVSGMARKGHRRDVQKRDPSDARVHVSMFEGLFEMIRVHHRQDPSFVRSIPCISTLVSPWFLGQC